MGTTPSEIIERQITTAFSGDWEKLRTLYAEDVRYLDPDGEITGVEQVVEHLQEQMVPFPDGGDVKIHKIYESGDAGIAEWSATMRNTGPLRLPDGSELPATDREVTLQVATIYDIADGVITCERNYWDNAALFAQLGLLPE